MKVKTSPFTTIVILSIFFLASTSVLIACSQRSMESGAKGAAVGSVVGAVGGLVTGLVFGGNAVESAARGAVYGGSTGAASGAISGAMADSQEKKAQKAAEEKALRNKLGEDAYQGLAALATCKHEVALGYGRTAAKSKNPDHALAGLWLQAIAYADGDQPDKARELYPDLVAKDDKISSESQAEEKMQTTLEKLYDIRKAYNLPPKCG